MSFLSGHFNAMQSRSEKKDLHIFECPFHSGLAKYNRRKPKLMENWIEANFSNNFIHLIDQLTHIESIYIR